MTAIEDPGDGVLAGEALGLGMRLLQLAIGLLDASRGTSPARLERSEASSRAASRRRVVLRSTVATEKVSAPPTRRISQGRVRSMVVMEPPATLRVQARPGAATAAWTALSGQSRSWQAG